MHGITYIHPRTVDGKTKFIWQCHFAYLQLPIDTIYMVTVQNIVRKYNTERKFANVGQGSEQEDLLSNKTQCNWEYNTALREMFDAIKHLLLQVSVFDTAVMCASWTAKELPMGKTRCNWCITCLPQLLMYTEHTHTFDIWFVRFLLILFF